MPKATKWILKQFKDVASSRDDIEIETVKEPETKQKRVKGRKTDILTQNKGYLTIVILTNCNYMYFFM